MLGYVRKLRLYTIALGFLLNLELTDYYDDQAGSEMFQGFGPMSMSTPGLIQARSHAFAW